MCNLRNEKKSILLFFNFNNIKVIMFTSNLSKFFTFGNLLCKGFQVFQFISVSVILHLKNVLNNSSIIRENKLTRDVFYRFQSSLLEERMKDRFSSSFSAFFISVALANTIFWPNYRKFQIYRDAREIVINVKKMLTYSKDYSRWFINIKKIAAAYVLQTSRARISLHFCLLFYLHLRDSMDFRALVYRL